MNPYAYGMDFGGAAPQINGEIGLMMLQKSLEAGAQTPVSGGGTGAPLLQQSLDPVLQKVTPTMEHAAFWRLLAKPAGGVSNIIDEWRKMTSLGAEMDGGSSEGVLGASLSGAYEYKHDAVKFFTHIRQVSHVLQNLPTIDQGSALAIEDEAAANYMGITLNRSCWWGEKAKNPLVFDGMAASCHTQGNVINKDGALFDVADIRQSAAKILDNFGSPWTLWMPPGLHQDIDELESTKVRRTGYTPGDSKIGPLSSTGIFVPTNRGVLDFEHDIFLSPERLRLRHTGIGETIPVAPVAAGAWTSPVNAATKAGAADAGNWYFKIVGVGAKGESNNLASGAVAVSAGDSVVVTINAATDVQYYRLYAAEMGKSTVFYRVATYLATSGAPTVVTYLFGSADNEYRPNTYCAFIGQPDAYMWRKAVDFFRQQLPTTLVIPFVYGLYGYLRHTKPEFVEMFKNIKPAVTY